MQDAGEAETGFTDGDNTGNEYGYDESGNLTRDDNKAITSITYDAVLNLPTEVVMEGKGTIRYTYDAAGTKLRQQVIPSDGSPTKTTDYVQGFHYEDNQLTFIQHEEGRLIVKDGLAYHYDLKDHLGNTRVTFSNIPVTTTAQATMEAGVASVEEAVFEGVAESRRTMAFHNTTDATIGEPDPKQVAALLPGQQGPAKSLRVHAGDTVRLEVNARYETAPGQVQGLEGIATQVAGAAARVAGGVEGASAGSGLNPTAGTSALANGRSEEVPPGYLNYVLYDEDFQPIDKGFQKVSKAAAVGKTNPNSEAEMLSLEIPIEEEGYLYTYLSHEAGGSPAASGSSARTATSADASVGTPVYFDDFTVAQQSYIVQVDDYYPFGLTHRQPLPNQLKNRYLFNGKKLVSDFGLNWYNYGLRNNYDPALGRFHSIDPLAMQFPHWSSYQFAGLNPIKYVDLDGAEPAYYDIQTGQIVPPGDQLSNYAPADAQFVGAGIDPDSYSGFAEAATDLVLGLTPIDEINTFITGQTADGREASFKDYVDAGISVVMTGKGGKGTGSKASALRQNAKRGASFEKSVKSDLTSKGHDVADQVTIKADNGVRTRVDNVSKKDGKIHLTEAKSSKTARLTKN